MNRTPLATVAPAPSHRIGTKGPSVPKVAVKTALRTALRAALMGAVLAVAAVIGISAPANAHNYLVTSTPEADSTIAELPTAFSITTNEALLDLVGDGTGFAIQVLDAAGQYYTDGCLALEGSTVSTGATLGVPGAYRLLWQVVSEDGHPVSGEFAFTWQPAAGAIITPGSATPPVCGEAVEPTPEPATEPSPTATATEIAAPIAAPEARDDAGVTGVLQIGAAILAVLGAGLVAFAVLRRRSRKSL